MRRREFIRALGAGTIAAAAFSGAPGMLSTRAATTGGYKALVCVFLFGGMDSHDVVIPFDQASYNSWREIRASFVSRQGEQRARSALLPLTQASQTSTNEPQFALPPEMPRIKALYDAGDAAIVANVGPLVGPVTRSGFEAGVDMVPPRLFSHNDQQAIWQAGAPEGAQFGWGGLFADAILASGGNANLPQFTNITTEEVGPFLTGRTASPFRVGLSGASRINLLSDPVVAGSQELTNAVRDQLAARSFAQGQGNVFEQDVANALSSSFDSNARYDAALSGGVPTFDGFEGGRLTAQLRAVANTISVRSRLEAERQIFFVGLGGFDTHSDQASSLPSLLAELDRGVSGFYNAMNALGLSQDVTVFTASDFGRTLVVNGDGTDHGWGGHHFVVGGAVNGGDIYGSVPPPVIGHSEEVGGGRLIPSIAVDQYAAQLGRWFGLTNSEVNAALPNLGRFTPLGANFI